MAVWITLFGSISQQVEGTLCLVSLSSLCWMFGGMGYLIFVYHLVSYGLMDAHFERLQSLHHRFDVYIEMNFELQLIRMYCMIIGIHLHLYSLNACHLDLPLLEF